jgi:hypothetical protein
MPCDTCVKRNVESNCQYAANAVRGKPYASRQRALNDRLKRLEESIQSFVVEGKVQQTAEESKNLDNESQFIDQANTTKSTSNGAFGNKIQKEIPGALGGRSQSNYVDPSHWVSILGDIKEVRESLSTVDNFSFNDESDGGLQPEIILAVGSESPPSIDDILTILPTRPTCDMLVSQYFNSRYMVLGMKLSGICEVSHLLMNE